MHKTLQNFLGINTNVRIKEETEHINIENLWNDETFICRYDKNQDFSSLEDVEILSDFSGFYHKEKKY